MTTLNENSTITARIAIEQQEIIKVGIIPNTYTYREYQTARNILELQTKKKYEERERERVKERKEKKKKKKKKASPRLNQRQRERL